MKTRKGNGNKRQKTAAMGPTCAQCGIEENCMKEWGPEVRLEKCGDCKSVRYCSEECKLAHWKDHKEVCKSAKQELRRKRVDGESLTAIMEEEWMLSLIEETFPSSGDTEISDKALLQQTKRAVDIMFQEEDFFIISNLFQRLLQDERAPLKVLCMARNEEERVYIVCQDIMNILLEGSLQSVQDSGSIDDQETWLLNSYHLALGLLYAFPGEADSDSVEPIVSSSDPQGVFCNYLYSKKRAALYLSANFSQHMELCKELGKRMLCSTNVPPSLESACMALLHLLVACLSYSEPAEAVLSEANEALVRHEETNKAGLKEFFQPLLALFQVVQNSEASKSAESETLMNLLSQVAALLVAQSRRVQKSPRPLFEVHTNYLEHMFFSQFNGSQNHQWAELYIPWAQKIVAERSE